MSDHCRAVKKSGERCANRAKYGAYCGVHKSYLRKQISRTLDAHNADKSRSLITSLDQYEIGFVSEFMSGIGTILIRATCDYCAIVVSPYTKEHTPSTSIISEILSETAKLGDCDLCALVLKYGIERTCPVPVNFNGMLCKAAKHGNIELCMLAYNWGMGGDSMFAHIGSPTPTYWNIPSKSSVPLDFGRMMYNAARCDDPVRARNLCILAHEMARVRPWDAIKTSDLLDVLRVATEHNNREICMLVHEWSASMTSMGFNGMLHTAARRGFRDLCILAHKWGATNLGDMIRGAIESGYLDLCALARTWITGTPLRDSPMIDEIVCIAQREGYTQQGLHTIASMWGARDATELLHNATMCDDRELCIYARDQLMQHGSEVPPDFNRMLRDAARTGSRDLCVLAYEWVSESGIQADIEGMLYNAALSGNSEICILARKWGSVAGIPLDLRDMVEGGMKGGHQEICELAKKWMESSKGGRTDDHQVTDRASPL